MILNGLVLMNEMREGASIEEVCTNHNISFKELLDSIQGCSPRRVIECNERYICRQGVRYRVQRKLGGINLYYGSYIHLEDAVRVRDELESLHWDVNPSDYIGDRFIYPKYKGYEINRSNRQFKGTWYGKYSSIEDARRVRDCLIKFDWDVDYLPLILRKFNIKRVD